MRSFIVSLEVYATWTEYGLTITSSFVICGKFYIRNFTAGARPKRSRRIKPSTVDSGPVAFVWIFFPLTVVCDEPFSFLFIQALIAATSLHDS